MHWRDRETCLRNAQRQVVGRLVREVPRHITALRRAGRTRGPPTVTQTSRPTLPRVRTLCTRASLSVGQHCGSNSHPPFPDLSRTYSELVPVATATSDRCTSKCARAPAPPGPQCACSPVLPPSHPTFRQPRCPLGLTCREPLAAPALTSWLRPSHVVSVRTRVLLRRVRRAPWACKCALCGLSHQSLCCVVFVWRPFRCAPARVRGASQGCADRRGSL